MKSILTGKMDAEIELLQRHVRILKTVMDNEPIGIIKVSEMLHLPQHKVRYSLRILEDEGLIEPSVDGAMTTNKVAAFVNNLSSLISSMQSIVDELKETL